MKLVVISALTSVIVSLIGTRWFITLATRHGWAQYVREDGPVTHQTKRGTPQMGGIPILLSAVVGYAFAHAVTLTMPTSSGLLVVFLMLGTGFVGFLDDWRKIRRERSLGLTGREKLVGQALVTLVFVVLATRFARDGLTPASFHISYLRDTWVNLAFAGTGVGLVLLVLWANVIIAGASNGVNLTDGLDGQAAGACVMVFGAYVLIAIWQFNQSCQTALSARCYAVRDPLDLAVLAAAIMGGCFGFLWWNAFPARLFMGDVGSLGLGGALAGLAITSRTELLMVIVGGLFVIVTMSSILQTGYFKLTKRRNGGVGKRLFKMAPLHHHFELVGWEQITITIRFWIVCGLCVGLGLGIFYAEWVAGR